MSILVKQFGHCPFTGTHLYVAEWVLWPPAQFINFYYLPTRYRVVYDNAISLIYDTYASYIQHSPKYNSCSENQFCD